MTIPELRVQAAASLGLGFFKEDRFFLKSGAEFRGDIKDYRDLPAADQIALTDRMAGMIKQSPAAFTPQQVSVADSRINSPYYGQPVNATSYINVTSELIKTGELQTAMAQGAKGYLNATGQIAAIVGLGVAVWFLYQASQNR